MYRLSVYAKASYHKKGKRKVKTEEKTQALLTEDHMKYKLEAGYLPVKGRYPAFLCFLSRCGYKNERYY